jgi:uncharacterized protein YndB with AHSA1/START domain
MSSRVVSTAIHAPIESVYEAITNPALIAKWRIPDNMTGSLDRTQQIIEGSFAITLTSTDGTSDANRGTYHSRFVKLRQNELVVEQIEFVSATLSMQTPITITTTFQELPGAILVTLTFDNVPVGASEFNDEKETKMALTKLTKLLEQKSSQI